MIMENEISVEEKYYRWQEEGEDPICSVNPYKVTADDFTETKEWGIRFKDGTLFVSVDQYENSGGGQMYVVEVMGEFGFILVDTDSGEALLSPNVALSLGVQDDLDLSLL